MSSLVGEKNKISGLTFYFSVIGAISDFSVDRDVAVHYWWSKLNLHQRVFTNITTTITIAIIVIIDNFCFTVIIIINIIFIFYKQSKAYDKLIFSFVFSQLKSTQKLGDVAYKVKRRLHMADINSVTVR